MQQLVSSKDFDIRLYVRTMIDETGEHICVCWVIAYNFSVLLNKVRFVSNGTIRCK